jgi:hypothetical protein
MKINHMESGLLKLVNKVDKFNIHQQLSQVKEINLLQQTQLDKFQNKLQSMSIEMS